MRRILVGATVAAVLAMGGGPAAGGMANEPPCPHGTDAIHRVNPTRGVIHESYHDAGTELGLAIASTGLSLIYHPFRMVYGFLGAGLGGFGGWATGGDLRTAKGLWRPTVEGDYYVRPDHLDGSEPFRFNGAVAPERVTYTVRKEVTTAAAPAPVLAPAPIDQETEDEPVAPEPDDML